MPQIWLISVKIKRKKNRDLIIVDGATDKVMGYAKGGKLFHANGEAFNDGDTFKPGEKTLAQFTGSPPKPTGLTDLQPPGGSTSSTTLTDALDKAASKLQGPPSLTPPDGTGGTDLVQDHKDPSPVN